MIDFLSSWWNLQVQQLQLAIQYWYIIVGVLILSAGIGALYFKK